MDFAAEGDDAVGAFASEPAGPAKTTVVLRVEAQLTNFFMTQYQSNVVIKRVSQGETHQRA